MVTTGIADGFFEPGASYTYDKAIKDAGQSITIGACTIEMVTSQNEDGATTPGNAGKPVTDETIHLSEVTEDLVFMIGGHAGAGSANCNHYKLQIYAEYDDTFLADVGREVRPLSLDTQNMAQTALEKVDTAIIQKDKIRAHLGALQNRFENTASNLRIQAENMQSAESRISDADVSLEMTEFTRSQILTQAATAMLTQANSLPRMLMKLLDA